MSSTTDPYNALLKYLADGTVDLDTDTIKVALVSSAYTFSAAHTVWADASAAEITGIGYTAGGVALANKTLTLGSGILTFDADDAVWSASTLVARRAVVYKEGTANGLTNPLLFSCLMDNTPADVSSTNSDFTIVWSGSGIISLAYV